MYCNNCGLKADPEDFFCSGCGKKIKTKPEFEDSKFEDSNLEMTDSESETSAPLRYNNTKTLFFSNISFSSFFCHKIPFKKLILNGIWIITLICVLGTSLILYSTFTPDSNEHSNASTPISQERIQADKNIRLCEQIATAYASSHTYSKDDVYDCDNMAQDVWDMLKAKGINARIAVGNFESAENGRIANGTTVHKSSDVGHPDEIEAPGFTFGNMNVSSSSALDSFNHAWVLAEISPDSWLAIECTGGYIVYNDENEKYYKGLTFSNPKNYRSFLSLYRDWKIRANDYEAEKAYYNELIMKYNNASYSEQITMGSGIEVAHRILREKEKAFLKTDSELNALLKYG